MPAIDRKPERGVLSQLQHQPWRSHHAGGGWCDFTLLECKLTVDVARTKYFFSLHIPETSLVPTKKMVAYPQPRSLLKVNLTVEITVKNEPEENATIPVHCKNEVGQRACCIAMLA